MLTNGSEYWSGVKADLTSVFIDTLRSRLIDHENLDDDRNVQDRVDLRLGESASPTTVAPGGVPLLTWGVLGVAVVAGAVLIKRLL